MNRWLAGARPRTLPAALVPVLVGTGVARHDGDPNAWRALAALVVALAIQVGTNYANDYSDGVRGTDSVRVGPVRLVASGLATAAQVRLAALLAFAVAAVFGLALAAVTSWWLVPVGAACFAAGWLYTGGPRPYGYAGLGELFVFLFFGLVATAGTAFVQLERVTWLALAASIPVGLLAMALLVVNNLRDIPTDEVAGKRTLAVRIGDRLTRRLYQSCVVLAILVGAAITWRAPLVLLALPFALGPLGLIRSQVTGPELIPVLGATGELQLVAGSLLALGLALS